MRNREEIIADLMKAGREESRASVFFRHMIAESVGMHMTDMECLDFLEEGKNNVFR